MHAAIAQLVERIHGKDEVPGSNPGRGSIFCQYCYVLTFLLIYGNIILKFIIAVNLLAFQVDYGHIRKK